LLHQVLQIAYRGRKRWLGLCFVTQLSANLPNQLIGLCNSFVFHKVIDRLVVNRLKQQVGGVDDGLWDHMSVLAPDQAVSPSSTSPGPFW
jgi:DNA helicase HerA-like ATPase